MSTTATPEAPAAPETAPVAPETAPVTTTTAAPAIEPTPESIRELTPALRDKLLFEAQDAPAKVEPEVEKPAEVVKPAEPEVPVEEEETAAETLPKNFRLHTEDPKQSAFLKAYKAAMNVNPQVNPADVARLVGYEMPGQAAVVAAPVNEQVQDDPIAVMTQEAEALAAKMDELAMEDMPLTPEYSKLGREYARKVADIEVAKLKVEHAAERSAERAHTERVSARKAIRDAVLQKMPTANDEDSILGAKIQSIYDDIKADPNHPDRARLARDDGPKWLAETARDAAVLEVLASDDKLTMAQALAKVIGKPEASRPATVATKAAASTVIPRTTAVVAAKTGTAPEPAPLDIEKVRQDPKLRDAALGFGGSFIIR